MKTLATYNIKGGVGKTAAAVNLAYLAARGGRRTLLWDLDPHFLENRPIGLGEHCFGCTAGAGSSCGGSVLAG